MQCREFSEIIDSYLKDELSVETNHDVIKHLEACPACRRKLVARRETRAQLRRAFAAAPDFQVRPEFAFKLRNNLKQQALGKPKPSFNLFVFAMRPQWLAVAACLLIAVVIGIFALRGGDDNSSQLARSERAPSGRNDEAARVDNERERRGAAVQLASFEVIEHAVGDHQNCAIKYTLTEEPISLEEAGRKYDSTNTGLGDAVRSGEVLRAGNIKYIEAHSCVYNNQRFAHVVLEHKGRTVSLLVAGTNDDVERNAPDDAIACSSINGYQVSCFGTKRHAVFVVSDLPEADNLAIARSIAPVVSRHIAQAEA